MFDIALQANKQSPLAIGKVEVMKSSFLAPVVNTNDLHYLTLVICRLLNIDWSIEKSAYIVRDKLLHKKVKLPYAFTEAAGSYKNVRLYIEKKGKPAYISFSRNEDGTFTLKSKTVGRTLPDRPNAVIALFEGQSDMPSKFDQAKTMRMEIQRYSRREYNKPKNFLNNLSEDNRKRLANFYVMHKAFKPRSKFIVQLKKGSVTLHGITASTSDALHGNVEFVLENVSAWSKGDSRRLLTVKMIEDPRMGEIPMLVPKPNEEGKRLTLEQYMKAKNVCDYIHPDWFCGGVMRSLLGSTFPFIPILGVQVRTEPKSDIPVVHYGNLPHIVPTSFDENFPSIVFERDQVTFNQALAELIRFKLAYTKSPLNWVYATTKVHPIESPLEELGNSVIDHSVIKSLFKYKYGIEYNPREFMLNY